MTKVVAVPKEVESVEDDVAGIAAGMARGDGESLWRIVLSRRSSKASHTLMRGSARVIRVVHAMRSTPMAPQASTAKFNRPSCIVIAIHSNVAHCLQLHLSCYAGSCCCSYRHDIVKVGPVGHL